MRGGTKRPLCGGVEDRSDSPGRFELWPLTRVKVSDMQSLFQTKFLFAHGGPVQAAEQEKLTSRGSCRLDLTCTSLVVGHGFHQLSSWALTSADLFSEIWGDNSHLTPRTLASDQPLLFVFPSQFSSFKDQFGLANVMNGLNQRSIGSNLASSLKRQASSVCIRLRRLPALTWPPACNGLRPFSPVQPGNQLSRVGLDWREATVLFHHGGFCARAF